MASQWIQYAIVAVAVLAAASYAAVKYLPKAWRRRLVYRLSNGSGNGKGRGRGRLVRWLDADASCGSGCDTCGSCETAPLPGKDEQGRKVIQLHVER